MGTHGSPTPGEMAQWPLCLTGWYALLRTELQPDEKTDRPMIDACHLMLPYLAQGSAQAMEDAAFLAGCLQHLPDRMEVAAEIYAKYRKPRATRIQLFSRQQRAMKDLPDGAEQKERYFALKSPGRQTRSHVHQWEATENQPVKYWLTGLYGYDAEK